MQENKPRSNTSEPASKPGPEHQNLTHPAKKLKIIWLIGGIASLILIAGMVFILINRGNVEQNNSEPTQPGMQQSNTGGDNWFMQQYGNGCKERDVSFTSPPMKMNELAFIRPLGAMRDGHVTPTDHVYLGASNPNAADNTYAVLMPADGTVTEISAMPAQYIGDIGGQQVATEDHRIVISHSCRYFSIYIHVHKLSDPLKSVVGTLKPNENKRADVDLKAGDIVGYIGKDTFDWTPIDTSKTLNGFITPSLYQSESWKVHTVSPFDLYKDTLKKELEAKSLRSVTPVGGKIDYDQPGKLIGTWFRQGSGGYSGNSPGGEGRYWDGHLSIVPDYIDPAYTIVSIGNWNGSAKQLVVDGKVNPANITEKNGLVKYEVKGFDGYVTMDGRFWDNHSLLKGLHPDQSQTNQGTIALQVMPGEKLKLEKFPGKTANQVAAFTSAAQIYER